MGLVGVSSGAMLYYLYPKQPHPFHPDIQPFGEIGKCDSVQKLRNLEITDKWDRNRMNLENVLSARDGTISASDDTFEFEKDKKKWFYFVYQHYDWYMFPWKANMKFDSITARNYSLSKGDIVDLILTENFIERYIHSIETLIECKKLNANNDPIHSMLVHPSRHPKLLCSIQYFLNVAEFINDTETMNKLNQLKTEVIDTFGDIDCGICNDHIWSKDK